MDMNQPIGATPLDGKPDGLVGRPIDRIDGRLKVTGRAPYAYETRDLKNPAYGFLVGERLDRGEDFKKNAVIVPPPALPDHYTPRGARSSPASCA